MNENELRKIWKELKKKQNVIGLDADLLPKLKEGEKINEGSLRVYVTKKLPISQFVKPSVSNKIRKLLGLKPKPDCNDLVPKTIQGVPTDVIELEKPKALYLNPKEKYRPVKAGISGAHEKCTACTLTGFFTNKENIVLVGGNNHCIGIENKAKVGDKIIQPSAYDGGKSSTDTIGTFSHMVELKYTKFKCPFRNFAHSFYRAMNEEPFNKVDIAFAYLTNNNYEIGTLNLPTSFKGVKTPSIGEEVQKNGRTTNYTKGKIESLNWTGYVTYARGEVLFTDCILVRGNGFSKGGDSSSPVFDKEGNLVGILFAGAGDTAILMKVPNVEKEANVKVIVNK